MTADDGADLRLIENPKRLEIFVFQKVSATIDAMLEEISEKAENSLTQFQILSYQFENTDCLVEISWAQGAYIGAALAVIGRDGGISYRSIERF